jgi:GNAT superfamily N-acetyltransferase
LSAPGEQVPIVVAEAAGAGSLRELWTELYAQQRREGMQLGLPDDAFDRWVAGLVPVLGRFGCLFVAGAADAPVGFLAGRLRSTPAHFGGELVGFVSEVIVAESQRGRGLGKALLAAAEAWFRAKGVVRVELQVVVKNESARRFYLGHGWAEELVQMVKPLRPSGD